MVIGIRAAVNAPGRGVGGGGWGTVSDEGGPQGGALEGQQWPGLALLAVAQEDTAVTFYQVCPSLYIS